MVPKSSMQAILMDFGAQCRYESWTWSRGRVQVESLGLRNLG